MTEQQQAEIGNYLFPVPGDFYFYWSHPQRPDLAEMLQSGIDAAGDRAHGLEAKFLTPHLVNLRLLVPVRYDPTPREWNVLINLCLPPNPAATSAAVRSGILAIDPPTAA